MISSTVGAAEERFAPVRRTTGFGLAGGRVIAALGRGGISVGDHGARLSLGRLAVGRAGHLRRLPAVMPRVRAHRVEYARGGGLVEWYAAGPLGIEQGFTLARRPAGAGAVMMALAPEGFRARMRGSEVQFLAHSGRVALRYGGLVARDARGRRLRARLSLAGSRLLLAVRDSGARYPLVIDPFIQQGSKLTGTGENGQGLFGDSLAVSADGTTALIGAPDDNNFLGAAWVFTRSGSTWTQQGPKLVGTGAAGPAEEGWSVALSGDGNTALIGGLADGDNNAGAVWVFTRQGSAWTQQGAKLTATDESGAGNFGSSVALSTDGNTALIGGHYDNIGAGAAWVFTRSASTWTQQGSKLVGSGATGIAEQGWSVALSGDGSTALMGGPFDNNNEGAVWVFTRQGNTWTQLGPKLTATGESGQGLFGMSVALSGDATTALIGAPDDNASVGAAWVFARQGGTWSQQGAKLTATDESGQGSFGNGVALSGDGQTALIGGAPDPDEGSSVGAAWVFTRQGGTWSQQGAKLTATDESGQGNFGARVALSGDGTTALIGAPNDNGGLGAAWMFAPGQYLYWDNPQLGPCPGNTGCPSIGRGTVDGNPANVNQNFITGIPQFSHVGVAVDREHIYWTGGFTSLIGRANLDGSGVNQKFIPVGAISLAVDDQHIYWAGTLTDVSTGGPTPYVGRANLDGSGVERQFIAVPGGALSVAVDSSHIYWTDPNDHRIGRANLDGTGVTPSFITGVVNPWGVAVDGQHIYWTQREGTSPPYGGSIGRANLDGAGVSLSFITGASEPTGVAVDYGHIYWTNYYDCSNDQTQSGCAGGTIGRANLDGSGVNQSFISADSALGLGCDLLDSERCGPSSVAVDAPTQPICLRTSPTPAPPPGGAVFAQPLDSGSSGANVVVIPAGTSWTGPSSCTGIAQGSDAVMTHPTSITVSPDAAVLLRDQPAGLVSAWGAQDVGPGDAAPVLFPGRSDWQTTEVEMIAPQQLLDTYNGCPACVLPNGIQFTPGQPDPNVAYQDNLGEAVLDGASLTGSFDGWNFNGAQLAGASLNGADVSGANFAGADLRGAQLSTLQFTKPPSFANVRVGTLNSKCTRIANTNLVGTGFTPAKADLLVSGCENSPLLPGSTAPLDLISQLTVTDGATVDYAQAQFLVTAANHTMLQGAVLNDINLAGASFPGFPVDFEGTKFNGASLQGTHFQLADLAGAQFESAIAPGASFDDANLNGATFAQATLDSPITNLQNALFIGADVSEAHFESADLSNAEFDDALAVNTSFDSVLAPNIRFDGAHIYGDGDAFDGARELAGADFVDAVLGGSTDGGGGFDLSNADLTGAHFDHAQCIACNFTSATLSGVTFSFAYLPGAQLSSAKTLQSASFNGAWLYCGDQNNDSCTQDPTTPSDWDWPLALGSQEDYGPVPFPTTTLTEGQFANVTSCPDGDAPSSSSTNPGCTGQLLPGGTLKLPAPCSAVALDACPTQTSTVFDATALPNGAPISVVSAAPPTWSSTVTAQGYYVGLKDGTVRLVGSSAPPAIVAHSPDPNGLAIGLDGSLYIADPTLHQVKRMDPSGTISTVAGSGTACSSPTAACGDGGPATAATLSGPWGVWASPGGELFIADGVRGIREVLPDGTITTIGPKPGSYDVVSVAGDAAGNLYAATNKSAATTSPAPTNNADYLIQVNLASGQVTTVVGTGTSGYNGNQGSGVEINHPGALSVALNGEVVFADTGNHLIRAYVPSSGNVIDDLGGLIANGVPQGGYNGDGQYADQTMLDNPAAVTVTRGALLVIADTGNARLRQIGPTPLAGQLGQPGPHPPPGGGPHPQPPPTGPSPPPAPPGQPTTPLSPGTGGLQDHPGSAQPGRRRHRPNNHFAITHVKAHRDGTITFSVTVHGPGGIDVLATAWNDNFARAAVLLHPAPRRFAYGRSHRTARRATTLHLRVRPNARGKWLVHHHSYRVVLRLWVSYTPRGGLSRTLGFHGVHLAR